MKPTAGTKKKPKYVYDWPKADNTVDAVVFGIEAGTLKVLLIERRDDPFKGKWALPGGFVNMDEPLAQAVLRELREETGVDLPFMEQLATFGDPGRDPRGRVISTAYLVLARMDELKVEAGDDAVRAKWFPVDALPPLAFDHDEIVGCGLNRLRTKARWQPIGINFLPDEFTISEMKAVYEAVLGKKLDARNFRSKVLRFGVLVPAGTKRDGHRPAMLWRFDRNNYEALLRQGVDFEAV